MSADATDGGPAPRARRPAAKTIQGVGAPPPEAGPGREPVRARPARDTAPTDLGFVPPPDAPKVEVDPSIERDAAAIAASFPPKATRAKARQPAAPTALMPDVQERRRRRDRADSDLPLKIGLGAVAVIIIVLVSVIAYFIARM